MASPPRIRVPMVRPSRATVARAVADLRGDPSDDAELVDQALFGESLTVLGERSGWSYVQGEDGYLGWVRAEHLRGGAEDPDWVVAVHRAALRRRSAPDGDVLDLLAPGTRCAAPTDNGWAPCGPGWVAAADLAAPGDLPRRTPTAADLIATAETFLGAPYLWGGVTIAGIDCSGLVQQVYRLNGVGLDRDADQQALGGRPVSAARAGDLLFFGAERVTHVALATGEREYIHAPMKGGAVERSGPSAARKLLAVRRYLADTDVRTGAAG
ncbi:MAG: NlpC/P60 family protein [Candidatus Limnocylindria bacterium]